MKKFICANCGKPITHGEWKKAGKLQRITSGIEFVDFDSDDDLEESKLEYRKFCSEKCQLQELIEEHIAFGMNKKEIKDHLKEIHGIEL